MAWHRQDGTFSLTVPAAAAVEKTLGAEMELDAAEIVAADSYDIAKCCRLEVGCVAAAVEQPLHSAEQLSVVAAQPAVTGPGKLSAVVADAMVCRSAERLIWAQLILH